MSKAKVTATPVLREKSRIMSASEIERTLIRLAHQIIEKNNGGQNLGLVGIKRRGVPLAQRLGRPLRGKGPQHLNRFGVRGVQSTDICEAQVI